CPYACGEGSPPNGKASGWASGRRPSSCMPYQTELDMSSIHKRLGMRDAMIVASSELVNSVNSGLNSLMQIAPAQVIMGPFCAYANEPICGSSQAWPSPCTALIMVARPMTSSGFQGSRKYRPEMMYT